tara:strand:- start:807 stop:1127 length:321 start_codon:yes stop_codon:yes gene_type:complete
MLDRRNPNSCFIELNPKCDKSYWTGELEVNIIASEHSSLDKESKESLLHLSQLVASTVALMEQDPNLTARLERFVNEAEEFIKEKSKPKVYTEGNIIRLDFNKDKK